MSFLSNCCSFVTEVLLNEEIILCNIKKEKLLHYKHYHYVYIILYISLINHWEEHPPGRSFLDTTTSPWRVWGCDTRETVMLNSIQNLLLANITKQGLKQHQLYATKFLPKKGSHKIWSNVIITHISCEILNNSPLYIKRECSHSLAEPQGLADWS